MRKTDSEHVQLMTCTSMFKLSCKTRSQTFWNAFWMTWRLSWNTDWWIEWSDLRQRKRIHKIELQNAQVEEKIWCVATKTFSCFERKRKVEERKRKIEKMSWKIVLKESRSFEKDWWIYFINDRNEEASWIIESIRNWNEQRSTYETRTIWKKNAVLRIRNIEQKIFVHWTIVWNRKDRHRKIDRRKRNVRWIVEKRNTWKRDLDVAFNSVSTAWIFIKLFEIICERQILKTFHGDWTPNFQWKKSNQNTTKKSRRSKMKQNEENRRTKFLDFRERITASHIQTIQNINDEILDHKNLRKWKIYWLDYSSLLDEFDSCFCSVCWLQNFQHIWANFKMNNKKNIVKEFLNITCMFLHTAKTTIYLEILQNKMKETVWWCLWCLIYWWIVFCTIFFIVRCIKTSIAILS